MGATVRLDVPQAIHLGYPNQIRLTQREPGDAFYVSRDLVNPPAGTNGIFVYNGTTNLPQMMTLGTGLQFSGNSIVSAPAYSLPAAKTVAMDTAFQCADTSKGCIISVTVGSTASLSLSGGTANTADMVIGTTSGIGSTGGTTWARYRSTLTGTLVAGLAVNTDGNQTFEFKLPAGAYGAVRTTGGSPAIVLATEQTTN
ncbi:hypothetical protein [Herbaspirillum aquaticum]|uniref:Uncharacterized protein n=1 Tax=Herbaspirillum aquaticum TaxID=568783 RepID=A0A225SPG1_9BURK|nr:hypothetical protein [Herbaspirillum aquaticum]OWY32867.1 hypothetical protein CEJ45_19415 [Herbaspirillum aquaticum]